MKPRVAGAANKAPKRPEWDTSEVQAAVGASIEQRSFMNYAAPPLGAKKYDATTLATMSAR